MDIKNQQRPVSQVVVWSARASMVRAKRETGWAKRDRRRPTRTDGNPMKQSCISHTQMHTHRKPRRHAGHRWKEKTARQAPAQRQRQLCAGVCCPRHTHIHTHTGRFSHYEALHTKQIEWKWESTPSKSSTERTQLQRVCWKRGEPQSARKWKVQQRRREIARSDCVRIDPPSVDSAGADGTSPMLLTVQ